MTQTTDLLLPGLLHLADSVQDPRSLAKNSPLLHRVLRFAGVLGCQPASLDDLLRNCLGQAADQGLPYAANASKGSSDVLFTPVSLRAGINNATILPVDENRENIDILINSLRDYFKVDFTVSVEAYPLYRMHLRQVSPVTGMPHYLAALGTPLTHYIETARTQVPWYRLLNEIQMFLHQHPLNQQRMADGRAAINSLWCWGGDRLPNNFRAEVTVFCDDPEIRALGNVMAQGGFDMRQLAENQHAGQRVIVDLSLLRWLKGLDQTPIEQLLARLDELLARLLETSQGTLNLRTGGESDLEFKPGSEWRVWRRPRYLDSFSSDQQAEMLLPDQPL